MNTATIIAFFLALTFLGCDYDPDFEDAADASTEDPAEDSTPTASDPCKNGRTTCEDGDVLKCEQGEWWLWDECTFWGEHCAVKNGKAKCFVPHESDDGEENEDGEGGEGGDGGNECSDPDEGEEDEPVEDPEEEDDEEEPVEEEPEEEAPVKDECLRKTYIVEDPEDLDELKQYNCLIGDLLVEDTWLTSIDLGNLQVIQGTVRITGNSRLVSVDFSSLEKLTFEPVMGEGSHLEIRSNPALAELALDSLVELHRIKVYGSALKELDLSQLEVLQYLYVSGNTQLTTVAIENVREMTVLELNSNPMLETFPTRQFEYILEIYINDNDSLQYIDFPGVEQDRFGHMKVVGNASLREFSIPGLTEVQGEVDISNNSQLTTINLGRLEETKRNLRIFGNDILKGISLGRLEIVRQKLEISQNATIPYWEDGQGIVSIASAMVHALDLQSLVAAGDLVLTNNQRLQCNPQAITSTVDVVGNTDIRGNASGCEL